MKLFGDGIGAGKACIGDNEILLGYEVIRDIRSKYICRQMPPSGFVTTYLFGYENDNPSSEYLKYKIFGQKYGGMIKETYYAKNLKRAKLFFAEELSKLYTVQGSDGRTRRSVL